MYVSLYNTYMLRAAVFIFQKQLLCNLLHVVCQYLKLLKPKVVIPLLMKEHLLCH